MFLQREKEFSELIKNKDFCFDTFDYELGNHEFIITGDINPALESLGLKIQDLSKMQRGELQKAINAQYENAE